MKKMVCLTSFERILLGMAPNGSACTSITAISAVGTDLHVLHIKSSVGSVITSLTIGLLRNVADEEGPLACILTSIFTGD